MRLLSRIVEKKVYMSLTVRDINEDKVQEDINEDHLPIK